MTDLAQVEPTISMLQDALVRYLISRGNKTSEKPAAATTTLFDLRSVFFGLADNDKDSAKSVHANPDAADKNVYVSLVISVLIPSRTEAAAAYKEKQAEALVMYHLRKYAASLNAVLCFVRTEEPVEEGKAIDALSIHQLSHVWHQLAKGEEGWKQFDTTTTTASEETEETPADTPPAETVMGVYGPGSHQEDLIESVLLRNAHFPGQWDASNDSLWVALPSATDDATANAAADAPADGDESWLRELRSSVTSEAVKTPPATAKGDSAADTAKTPNDAELSSFFDSLLKP
ncbi:expressed unknown protein [Seminavis robusta]|uniref:Uncharacterized protein n=1 Tax=Seminavis robusta TaxID=568900 RepID=A0A9N8HU32_9STRA|nr:expressed unknown protein [Seminavis robusta]|eukprot:Sro1985_g309480.1 n/a (290) ;mRNA; r:18575-19444